MRVIRTSLALTLGILLAGCGDGDDGGTTDIGGDQGDAGQQPATCQSFCEDIVAAACDTSPRSASECPGLCTGIMSTSCSDELDSLIYCAGDDPVVTCNQSGDPTMDACTTEFTTYQECLEALEG